MKYKPMKKTVVLGASLSEGSYANMAMHKLAAGEIEAVGIGLKEGSIAGVPIFTGTPFIENVHTITLYLNPKRQLSLVDYMLSLHPQRVIFNPGTENPELANELRRKGIETVNNCTLVLLATHQY